MVLVAFLAISQKVRAYELRGSCYGNNLSTVTACCNDGCEGTNYWSGCYVYDALGTGTAYRYYCECFGHPNSPVCTSTCTDDCSSGQTGCNSAQTKRWTCGEANDGDTCKDKIYTNCSSGYYCSNGSCVVCSNECSSGQTGCSNSTQNWSCVQNANSCWVKSYSTCPSGYTCSNGSCISQPNTPPTLSNPYYTSGLLFLYYFDAEGDSAVAVGLYLYNSSKSFLNYYNLTQYSGGWYVVDFNSLTDGFYYYQAVAYDGKAYGYYPSSDLSQYASFTKITCNNECNSGESACNNSTQRWYCAQDTYGCRVKVTETCSSGQACSNGTCQAISLSTPVLSASASIVRNNIGYNIRASTDPNYNGYEFQEDTNSSFTNQIGWSQAAATKSFSHLVTSKTTYYYRARAVGLAGQYSSWSNIVSVVIDPCTDECSFGSIGCNSISQRWSCSEANDGDICLDKINTNCQSGYSCSNGNCIQNCTSDCVSGQMGCNGSSTVTKCQLDSDGCYHMLGWQTCNVGYACSGGSCVVVNHAPVISNYYYNASNFSVYVTITDQDGDQIQSVYVLFFKWNVNVWEPYGISSGYKMQQFSGNDSKTGIIFSLDIGSFPDSTYAFWYLLASDGKDTTILPMGPSQAFSICHPNWQCGSWSNCYYPDIAPPGYKTTDWIQKRSCSDIAGCSAQITWEYKPCDCNYTTFEWVPPLTTTDGNEAYFKLTWTGNCQGDHLVIQQQTAKPPFCYCSNDMWKNEGDPLIIDEYDAQGNEQIFPWQAFYADASFRLFLERNWASPCIPIMPTSNYLDVKPRSFPADTKTFEQAIHLTQIPAICNADTTLTDECYRYWAEMGISYESQLINSFSAYQLAWFGTCVACTISVAAEPSLILSWLGGPISASADIALVITGNLACDFCSQMPISLTETRALQLSDAFMASQALKRVDDLSSLGIIADYIPAKNGAYITYLDDVGKEITEAYGISSQGTNSLTFSNKIQSFPFEIAEDYNLINVHRNLVPLNLRDFQELTLSFNEETAKTYWENLQNMFDDDLYLMEADHAWQVGNQGKLPGSIRDYVQDVTPIPGIDYAHASYASSYDKWVITFNLANDVLPTASGGLIPQWEAAVYGMLPHEYIHVSTFALIEKFTDPYGVQYVLASIPKTVDATNCWFAEFYAHTIYVEAIKNDPLRYQKYIDSIYGLVHQANGGIDNWIAETVEYSKSEATMMYAQKNYQLIKLADYDAAQKIINQLDDPSAFLARNQEIENDAYSLFFNMVEEPGFQASNNMDWILKKYKLVVVADSPPLPPPPPPTPEPRKANGGSGSKPGGCNSSLIQSDTNQILNFVLLMLPGIYLLLRKKIAKQY